MNNKKNSVKWKLMIQYYIYVIIVFKKFQEIHAQDAVHWYKMINIMLNQEKEYGILDVSFAP